MLANINCNLHGIFKSIIYNLFLVLFIGTNIRKVFLFHYYTVNKIQVTLLKHDSLTHK
jgi:hypothetical protein